MTSKPTLRETPPSTIVVEIDPVLIGIHKFLPLTIEACKLPYIDLPDTLSPKERRKVHSLCSYLDLYHTGAGSNSDGHDSDRPIRKRRIVISIYADGFDSVPDLEACHNKRLPCLRDCQPWYNQTWDIANYNSRKQAIESEKEQIRQFVSLPEKSLRMSDGANESFCDCLDFDVLNSLNLSSVPIPEQTPWMLVNSVDKLKLCVEELRYGVRSDGSSRSLKPKIREMAFDLEMSDIFIDGSRCGNKTQMRTCLIQVTSDVATCIEYANEPSEEVFKDYIIDPLSPGLWDGIRVYLGPLFSDPNIVKIGHGIGGMDVSSLHRDFGILIVNAFDTYEASAILSPRKSGMGLAPLCRHYGLPNWEHYTNLKNKYQCSDWQKRPLDEDALNYGRYDIRFLVTLRKLLMRDLVKLDVLGRDNSDVDSVLAKTSKGGTHAMISNDSQLSSSFITENKSTATTNLISPDQFKDYEEFVKQQSGTDIFVTSASLYCSELPLRTKIYASEFPCHHHLMQAISISQKRCLKLWTGQDEEESMMKNSSLLFVMKQATNQKGHLKHWTDANMELYRRLCVWRSQCACREKIHASQVCSLEFLVHMALKMPKDKWEMRRHSYFLPLLLDDDSLPHCHELCDLVTSSAAFQQRVPCMDIVFYSNKDVDKSKQGRPKLLLKVLITSAVVGVILLAVTRRK